MTKRIKLEEKVVEMAKEIDDLKEANLKEQPVDTGEEVCLNSQMTSLGDEIKLLKEEMKLIKEHDLLKSEIVFTFELRDVNQFFEKTNSVYSDFFYCAACQWTVDATYRHKGDKEGKFLEVYLHNYNAIGKTNWSIKAQFEIRIIGQTPGVRDKVKSLDCEFSKEATFTGKIALFCWFFFDSLTVLTNELSLSISFITHTGFGNTKMATFDELMRDYVKDDTITIRIHLKAGKLAKI